MDDRVFATGVLGIEPYEGRLLQHYFGYPQTRTPAEEDRQKALLMARAFAQRLPAALEELPRDCGCLVVLKSAVAGPTPQMVELTAALRRKLEAP